MRKIMIIGQVSLAGLACKAVHSNGAKMSGALFRAEG